MSVASVDTALLDELDARGSALIPGALDEARVGALLEAVTRVYDRARAVGEVSENGSLHLLEVLGHDPAFLELVDLPATLPLVVAALGWNIHLYHSHLDVHPPEPPAPPVWRWHQTAVARISTWRPRRDRVSRSRSPTSCRTAPKRDWGT